jgi:hypothetical protein
LPQHNKDFIPCCPHAGAANSHDATFCLNTTKTRFVVLEDTKVNVHPEAMDPRLVRRRIVAEEDEHASCYLIARDILKVRQHCFQRLLE